jgi:hypothetical protein
MTAVHESSFGEILKLVEQNSHLVPESKRMIDIQEEIYNNDKLRKAMDYEHGTFQVRDGLLENARSEFLHTIGSWKVKPHELEEKTAECLNATSKLSQPPRVGCTHRLTQEKYIGRH